MQDFSCRALTQMNDAAHAARGSRRRKRKRGADQRDDRIAPPQRDQDVADRKASAPDPD